MNTEQLLELLVCPKCHGKLSAVQPKELKAGEREVTTGLLCQACSLVYALNDGLPNMLISEAQSLPTDA
jgi:uncharacterized protein